MPMNKQVVGKDEDGKPVVMVWGADLNWAHGFVEGPEHQQKEYYRAQGKGNAHYIVARDIAKKLDMFGKPEFKYWYVTMHVDGETINLPSECMNAYEGQELAQIFESERRVHKEEHARIAEERKDEPG